MISQTMDEEDITGTLLRYNKTITSKEDARAFLKEKNLSKDNSIRLIAWLVILDIIPANENDRGAYITNLVSSYEKGIKEAFGIYLDEPLKALEPKVGNIIKGDIDRSINHFRQLASQMKIAQTVYVDEAYPQLIRMLSYLALKQMTYIQGFDRYAIVSYLLAAEFAKENSLPPLFAEVLTYSLCPKIVLLSEMHTFLDHIPATQERYNKLDLALYKYIPNTMNELRLAGNSAFHFALRWEIVMFADEYDAAPLLLLWDQFLANKERFKEYSFNICIAHAEQAPSHQTKSEPSLLEAIQSYKDWDVIKIIDRANELTFHHTRVHFSRKKEIIISLFILFFLIIFLFFQMRSRKQVSVSVPYYG